MAGNVGSVGTALSDGSTLTDPSSLAAGSLGSDDLGNLLSSDDISSGVAAPNFSAVSAATPTPSVSGNYGSSGSSTSAGGLGSLLSSLGGDLSGLGTLAGYGGIYALLSGEASSAANQNNALAGQISAIGQPLVSQGQALTSAFSQGTLTSPYQQQVTAAENTNANTAISQNQQVASLLANSGGGQNVQGAEASESQQIGNAQNQANTAAVASAFTNELSAGLGLVGTGGSFVQSGVEQEISSNTALQGQLANLMGMLANAYAKQTSGSGGTGSSSGTSSFGSLLNSLLGGGSTSAAQSAVNAGAAADTASNVNSLSSYDASAAAGNNTPIGDIDANMNADTTANLNAGLSGGLNDSTVSTGDFLMDDGSSVSSNVAGDVGSDVASDVLGGGGGAADDLLGFSEGSGAAAAAQDSTAAASGALSGGTGALSSLGGDVLGLADVGENPTSVGGDIQGAADVYNLASTVAGSGSTIGTGALGAGLEVAVPAFMISTLVGSLTEPNDPDSINTAAAKASGLDVNEYGALPSGNSILTDQNVGVGAGTQSSQGSGEIYAVDPSGSAADNDVYHWIGQSDSTALESDVSQYEKGLSGQQSFTPTDALGLTTGEAGTVTPFGSTVDTTQPLTPSQEESGALASMGDIYNSTGGASLWGMSESEFNQALLNTLGSGVYKPGTAYGVGN